MKATLRVLLWPLALGVCALASFAAPPNFLIVVADDLGYGDLRCYGDASIHSPNLDRFAAEGLKLTSYYAAPNCSPSRTGMMTGRIPSRAGITDWIPQLSPMHVRRGETTVATLLRRAGYATCLSGKWHLNGGFEMRDQPQPNDHGFDHWFATQNLALPNHRNPTNFFRNGQAVGPLQGYAADLVADEAIRWLGELRDKSKPFFLYVAFHEPHEPIATAKNYVDLYPAKEPSYADHHGNITQLDAAFGRLLRALDAQGLRDTTLVFFTSDNGPAITPIHPHGSAGPLREKKGHVYEGGIRVPGLVRWPGRVRAGSTSDTPVSGMDILPTLCELAGVTPPRERKLDGVSFVPLLDGKNFARPQPLFWHFFRAVSEPKVAMRDGDWKLLARLDQPNPSKPNHITVEDQRALKTAELTTFELYNLRDDLGETRDLAAKEPARLAGMVAQMQKLYHEVRDECPEWPAWEFANYDGPRIEWPPYWKPRGGAKK
ncbi:MAG: sulfatase-like hydrolase/transferase [Verrucomicrobia bacterium]|nr:sulfatase-like hydrolase/transferase [Verrucomicrobiota bacterium]